MSNRFTSINVWDAMGKVSAVVEKTRGVNSDETLRHFTNRTSSKTGENVSTLLLLVYELLPRSADGQKTPNKTVWMKKKKISLQFLLFAEFRHERCYSGVHSVYTCIMCSMAPPGLIAHEPTLGVEKSILAAYDVHGRPEDNAHGRFFGK